jgi:hypothetical protein
MHNNLNVGDVVFIGFEENAIEKPVIIGKLFIGASAETSSKGGATFGTLKVTSNATLPSATLFEFPKDSYGDYTDVSTFKKMADYILLLEKRIANLENRLTTLAGQATPEITGSGTGD